MATICNLIPLTNKNEESLLYKGLLAYTANNRKLCNFLYAAAILKDFIDKCKPSELTVQREPSVNKVIEAFNVKSMLDTSVLVEKAHAELGTSVGGTLNLFDKLDTILDDVIDFNNRPDNPLRAVIKQKEGKYLVEIDLINDSNFSANSGYIAGKLLKLVIMEQFSNMSLNTSDWSKLSLRGLSALNAGFFMKDSWIKFRNLKSGKHKLTTDEAAILIDLFKDNDLIKRMISIFGEYTPHALKFIVNKETTVPSELIAFDEFLLGTTGASPALRWVDTFIGTVERKFKTVDFKEIEEKVRAHYTNTVSETESAIKETLRTLYEDFHLDMDTIDINIKELTNVEEATKAILVLMHNVHNVLKKRELLTPDKDADLLKKMEELEDLIAKKLYALSITLFMQEVVETLKDTIEITKDEDIALKDLNGLASLFLELQEQIHHYIPIVRLLLNAKILLGELEPMDIADITQRAANLELHLKSIDESLKAKKFAFAYNYIKRFWGEDNHYTGMGLIDRVLESCMTVGTVDMNVIDRYILSATEVHDSVLATVAESIKDMHEIRDEEMRKIDYEIRVATDKLYLSGSDTSFMYEEGNKGALRIISNIDWDTFYNERNEFQESLKARGISGKRLKNRMKQWDETHKGDYEMTLSNGRIIKLTDIPLNRKAMPNLTAALKEYYETMMEMKYEMECALEDYGVETFLFRPVLVPKSKEEAYSTMSPAEVVTALKNDYLDWTVLGSSYGVIEKVFNADGDEVHSIPVFYIDKLSDLKNVSRNFSSAMMAFMLMGVNHNTIADRASILEVTRSFLLDREIETSIAGKPIVQSVEALGLRMHSTAKVKSSETPIKGWLEDLYEAKLYGKRHKMSNYGEKFEVAVKTAVQYTSVTGLAMNLPGAIANVLVGKVQMFIEAAGNEFAGFKDFTVAEGQYWNMLPSLLAECQSNNKKSKLGLLLEKFDAMDDFYDKLRESGFYKSPISRIIGNSSLFFMYGLGEHFLHGQNMLAVLNHTKVKSPEGKMVTLLDAFEVLEEGDNGKIVLKPGYTYSFKESKDSPEIWKPVNEAFVKRIKKRVGYVNRSLNGAFGADEKGAIHRYALGRLVMNFRLWMPAHYARRFNTLHWDADLEDYREGYYVSTWKFAQGLYKDFKAGQFNYYTRYNSLTPMEKANVKRAMAESALMIMLAVLTRVGLGGDDKDHRSWMESMAMYQLQRCKLETGASNPLYAPGFLSNIFTIINSPAASINTVQKLTPLLNFDEIITGEKYESGKNAGEYKYVHRIKKALPFYSLVYKWWNMDIDDSIFSTFNN